MTRPVDGVAQQPVSFSLSHKSSDSLALSPGLTPLCRCGLHGPAWPFGAAWLPALGHLDGWGPPEYTGASFQGCVTLLPHSISSLVNLVPLQGASRSFLEQAAAHSGRNFVPVI